ncbi:MAG TPA: F0F1 ATP synthase subunit A [Pirellulales bacterium]|nr:F0F1 ATP synthase subunit A [Pirellulales bacterium]
MGAKGMVPEIVARFGAVEVSSTVVYSLIASGVLIVLAVAVRIGMQRGGSRIPLAAECLVEHLDGIMSEMSGADARPFTPLIVTLALFIATANLLGLAPGMHSPTADFSTTAALAAIVFVAVPFYGIRVRGLRGYLRHYLEPSPLLLPLEIVTEFSRTLALAVRLFGNVMSEELVIAVMLTIAGLFVPVPLMLLAVLTGVVQAYIFTVLTVVYVSAAVRARA